jgi:hypothetical protein
LPGDLERDLARLFGLRTLALFEAQVMAACRADRRKGIMDRVTDSVIYNEYLGSDHCPVGLKISS